MNFYGHATIAYQHTPAPPYILGSMFPDFVSMSGNRVKRICDDVISDGVALHQATDNAFHRSPIFIELCSEAAKTLNRNGVKSGSARAVAHAGIELFLDGSIEYDQDVCDAYHEALDFAGTSQIQEKILWRSDADHERWQLVIERLQTVNIPDRYRDPGFVVQRLVNMLVFRPQLALSESELVSVEQWAERMQPLIEEKSTEMMWHVYQGLQRMGVHSEG